MSEVERTNFEEADAGASSALSPPQAAPLHGAGVMPESAALASAPREVTPKGSRRAWHEPRVHFWWIVALGLVAAAAWLAAQQWVTWNRDARLVRSGTQIDAVVWLWGARVTGRPIGPEDVATLEFNFNGLSQVLTNQRVVGRDVPTHSGDTIAIYVDPENPQKWTARAAPPPLAKLMMGAGALVAVGVLLAAISVLKRRSVLSTWRNGEARQAAVVETSQSALAPRSRLVRCALTDSADRRLITIYVPHHAAAPQPGDALWLIMPPGKPDRALAAMLYE